MPYVVNREIYGWPENLAFLPPRQVTHRLAILRNVHQAELGNRKWYVTFGRMLDSWGIRSVTLWEFFAGPGLTLPLLMLPCTIPSRKLRIVLLIGLVMLALNTCNWSAFLSICHRSPRSYICSLPLE